MLVVGIPGLRLRIIRPTVVRLQTRVVRRWRNIILPLGPDRSLGHDRAVVIELLILNVARL